MYDVQIMKLAASVRPACRFRRTAALINEIEPSVGIGLQNAVEVGKVGLRMDALAVWRIGQPDSRWHV